MPQRGLLNLGLLLLVIALVLVVWQTPSNTDKSSELPKLTALDPLQVQQIHIERENQEAIELKKVQGVWQMLSPLQLPAHDFRIQAFLQLLSTRNYRKLDAAQIKLAELKLAPAPIKLQFDNVTLEFGDQSPMNDHLRYLKINTDAYLLTDNVHHFLNGDAVQLASLSPLGSSPKLEELQLPSAHLQLKGSRWSLLSLPETGVDSGADALNTLIDNWEHAQALNVKRYHPESTTATQGEVRIGLQNHSTLRFKILSVAPEFVLGNVEKGVEYHLPSHQVAKLLNLPVKIPEAVESSSEASPDATVKPTIPNPSQ